MAVVTGIRDRVGDRFLGLDLYPNDRSACRGFVIAMDNVRRNGSDYVMKTIEDYEVWFLGVFDEESGSFDLLDKAHVLMYGIQALKELNEVYESED